jgi:F-type H+-transporting ATPase subunit b
MEPDKHLLFWKTVNIIVLFAILYWLLKKPVSEFLSGGVETVKGKFDKARKEKEEALELLKQAEERSRRVKEEAEKIVSYSKEVAEREREQIIREANETAKRIIAMANEEIEKELFKAKEELKKFAAEKSVEIAESRLRGNVTADVNKKLIETTLEKL